MTFQQLKYLLEISKHQSISKAASALFVTQPSISKAIRDLEIELGITILDRTNKGVSFTQQGNELLFYAKVVLEQSEAIHFHFNKEHHVEKKHFAISSQHYVVPVEALTTLVQSLHDIDYKISFREGKTTDVMEDVYSSKSLIGILAISDLNKAYFERHFQKKGLQFTPLNTLQQHVFLRKEHPLANENELTLQQLADYPYLSYQQDDLLIHVSEETLHLEKIRQLVYVNDRGTMSNILARTNSYNIGTGVIIEDYLPTNITAVPLQNGQQLTLGYIKRLNTSMPDELQSYLDTMKQSLENLSS